MRTAFECDVARAMVHLLGDGGELFDYYGGWRVAAESQKATDALMAQLRKFRGEPLIEYDYTRPTEEAVAFCREAIKTLPHSITWEWRGAILTIDPEKLTAFVEFSCDSYEGLTGWWIGHWWNARYEVYMFESTRWAQDGTDRWKLAGRSECCTPALRKWIARMGTNGLPHWAKAECVALAKAGHI